MGVLGRSSPMDVLGEFPLQDPPPGIKSNFDNPDSNAIVAYIFAAACVPLVLLFAGLRLYAKTKLSLVTTWIDYYYLFSLAAGFAYIGLIIFFVSGESFGHHAWDVQVKNLTKEELQVALILQLGGWLVMWLVKLNLFLLFLQVFQTILWLKVLAFVGVVLSGCCYIAMAALNGFYCVPRDGQTQLSYFQAMGSAQCQDNVKPLAVISAAVNIGIDFYILVIPLPAVWLLQLPLRQRLGVLAIFLTGLLACAASVLGLIYKIKLNDGTDSTWDSTSIHAVGILEVSIGLMIPCMPAASKVMLRTFPAARSLFTRSASRPTKGFQSNATTQQGSDRFAELKSFDSLAKEKHPKSSAAHGQGDEYPEDWPLKTPPVQQGGFIQKTTHVQIVRGSRIVESKPPMQV